MPYQPQLWTDGPAGNTPVSAARLLHIENGVQVATALAEAAIPVAQKGVASGVASLDLGGTIPDAQIPGSITRDSELATSIAALVNAAPDLLNTLNELATAIGDDPNFATTILNDIAQAKSGAMSYALVFGG